ncbi:MAG: bifunctional phosphoribosyl-AMP cyclohydrolase/phosphoribosyl-ATP diphosphatase HisIE [Actinobacteria bacterium]|nr:bifunctional phosphoribosyl-AMP cyclohydrolase/phosphoribosyl-ATP diphosphatase HisIE [Actinomycetota bacterium]
MQDNKKKSIKSLELIPAIIQDYKTNEVLMLAYMSKESLKKSVETGATWFWSRSRKQLWNKGETSGNTQTIKEIKYDCDGDTLLIKVEQKGNACHTGNISCFFNEIDFKNKTLIQKDFKNLKGSLKDYSKASSNAEILYELYDVVVSRIEEKASNSYTYSLHKKGLDEIIKKIGEESVEIMLSSKHQAKGKTVYEIADLIYHLIVLMVEKKIKLDEIFKELKSRRK